jgi:bifunctional DNA-binding transcriptional regulator/antitoxin component of YhaV-PrlF toxin-antitoxin module
MSDTITLQLTTDGGLFLPEALWDRYGLQPGDSLTLRDLGEVFVLSPLRPQFDAVTDPLKEELTQQGETLESAQAALREQREETC